MTPPLSTLTVEPDPRGPLVNGDPGQIVALRTTCDPQLHAPVTVRYEAVETGQIALAARLLLRTHHEALPTCDCCADLEQRYGMYERDGEP